MIFDFLKVFKIASHYNQQHYKGFLSYQLQGGSENLVVWNNNLYVGDISGDTSAIIWQRVMVGQQILCTSVGPAWKHCLLVIGCLFLHFDWMMCLLPILF